MMSYLAIDRRGCPFVGVHTLPVLWAQRTLRKSGSFYICSLPLIKYFLFSQESLRVFFGALEDLLSAGLSLNKSLSSLARSSESPKFRLVMEELLYSMNEHGISFSCALKGYARNLGEGALSTLSFSEKTGSYPNGCKLVVSLIDSQLKLNGELSHIGRQLALIAAFMCATFISLLALLVPQIKIFFEQNNIVPSAGTQVVIALSDFLVNGNVVHVLYSVAGILMVLLAVASGGWFISERLKTTTQQIFLVLLTHISPLYRSYVRMQFWSQIDRFLQANISITNAIDAFAKNPYTHISPAKTKSIYADLERGSSLTEAFLSSDFASPTNKEIIGTLNGADDIGRVINSIHRLELSEFNRRLDKLKLRLYPTGITILTLGILWMIYVILMPVYRSVGDLM